jgi:hypothetical protein
MAGIQFEGRSEVGLLLRGTSAFSNERERTADSVAMFDMMAGTRSG